jgi:hypothetical protein
MHLCMQDDQKDGKFVGLVPADMATLTTLLYKYIK